jgi:hypothetical protein
MLAAGTNEDNTNSSGARSGSGGIARGQASGRVRASCGAHPAAIRPVAANYSAVLGAAGEKLTSVGGAIPHAASVRRGRGRADGGGPGGALVAASAASEDLGDHAAEAATGLLELVDLDGVEAEAPALERGA